LNRRHFLTQTAAVPFSLKILAAHAIIVIPPTPLADRYRLTRDRILHGTAPAYTPDFLLEDITATPGRRFTNFSGDVSGRWIGALATSAGTYNETFPTLAPVVARVIAQQHADGFFGKAFHYDHPDDNDLALLWGNGRLLIGLLEYFTLTGDPATLASARRLGDFLVKLGHKYNSNTMAEEFGASHFASSYICWTQQTEGLAALYAVTREEKYRDLCLAIAQRIERRPADHVHGYLCSLRGVMLLYKETRDPSLLALVEREWSSVTESPDLLLTGGVPEAWTPKRARTEGCAECDWLRLNLQLAQATGNPKYIASAETTLFNEFAMNQFATGDFGHGELDSDGVTNYLRVRAWWCCTLHGMRAFADVTNNAFRATEDEITYLLPVDATHTTATVTLRATSALATNGTITIFATRARGQTLTIRLPEWATQMQLIRNGNPVSGTKIRNLKSGDSITIAYAISHRSAPWRTAGTAFWYGPWLLGAASEVNPGYFNELQRHNMLETKLNPIRIPNGPFRVPTAAAKASYLPAEFPEQPQTVELRAVAEQTAMPSTPWQLVFKT
jgi:DUF1680 family protein